jgi:hypothetical protein
MSISQDSSKEELWEARFDASSGARFFVHRHTKAVRYSPPSSHSPPEVLQSPRIRFAGSVDAFRKQLVIIASSQSIAPDAKVKQFGHVLSDAWALLCADASADHAADPVLYVGVLMDIYESTCISASAMLGEDIILASCLSFLVKSQHGATLLLQTICFSFHADNFPLYLITTPHITESLIKKAVVESVRAKALAPSSTPISLPPAVRKAVSLLLSIGTETHKIICHWLMQGCQAAVSTSLTPALVPTTPQSDDCCDPEALIRSICDGNKFFAELCKYLASETRDLENLLWSILYDVISECAALTSLLTSATPLVCVSHLLGPNAHIRLVKDNPADSCIPSLLLSIFSSFTVNDDGTVLLLPHSSASEIQTLAIIAEHCIHTALQSRISPEEAVKDSVAESSGPIFLEVDAMDYCNKWYKAVVVEGDLNGNDYVKVHFVGCT